MSAVDDVQKALEGFIKGHEARFEQLQADFRDLEKRSGRPDLGFGSSKTNDSEGMKAMDAFVRRGDDSALADLQRKAMNSGTDTDGGFLVPVDLDRAIDRIAPTISAMYRVASIVETGTAKWEKLVKTAGMAMRRVANGATGGETTEPKYSKVSIEVFPAEVEPWVHNETLEDSFVDLAADLAAEAGTAFAEGAGGEFITGNGVGCARGILSYPIVANASFEWGKVGYIASGKSAAFTSVAPADKLIDLVTALKPQYRNGATWLMNDKTLGVCRQMKDGSGSYYLWQADPTKPFGGTLLGYPVEIDENLPDIGAGSYSIAFGDFKRGYSIVNRTGTTLIRDNITTKGQTKFNFRRRFGGGITHFEAIKLMKFATS